MVFILLVVQNLEDEGKSYIPSVNLVGTEVAFPVNGSLSPLSLDTRQFKYQTKRNFRYGT